MTDLRTASPFIAPDMAVLSVGDIIADQEFPITREHLVMYAGASGDFNAIHYREDIALEVGLEGVLVHGMLTMGLAVQPVMNWIGDPGLIDDYQVKFTRPIVVDGTHGALVNVVAKVGALDPEASTGRIDLIVTSNGATVLGKAQVQFHFSPRE